jgi:hypothetical protein
MKILSAPAGATQEPVPGQGGVAQVGDVCASGSRCAEAVGVHASPHLPLLLLLEVCIEGQVQKLCWSACTPAACSCWVGGSSQQLPRLSCALGGGGAAAWSTQQLS